MTEKTAFRKLTNARKSIVGEFNYWNMPNDIKLAAKILEDAAQSVEDDLTLAQLRDLPAPKRGSFYAKFPRMAELPACLENKQEVADYKRRWAGFVRMCKMLTREEGRIAVKLLDDGSLELAA